jgi:hypothetical protein
LIIIKIMLDSRILHSGCGRRNSPALGVLPAQAEVC